MRNLFIAVALLLALAVTVQAQEVQPAGVADKDVNFVAITGTTQMPYVIRGPYVTKKLETGNTVFFVINTYQEQEDGTRKCVSLFCIAYGQHASTLITYRHKTRVYIEGCLQWRNYQRFLPQSDISSGLVVRVTSLKILN